MKKHLLWMAIIVAFAFTMASTGQAATISYNTTTDNEFTMYLSTDPNTAGPQIASGDDWPTTYSGTAALNNISVQYLQVYGVNWGGPGGFIGDFTLSDTNFYFANGTQSLLTNITDWFVSTTGFNAYPNVASYMATNGVYSVWGPKPNISSNADWIWVGDDKGPVAYISAPIYSSVPLPPTFLLLGSGLLGLVGWRRFRKG